MSGKKHESKNASGRKGGKNGVLDQVKEAKMKSMANKVGKDKHKGKKAGFKSKGMKGLKNGKGKKGGKPASRGKKF